MRIQLHHLTIVRGFSERPGFCRRQARVWFKRHGLDWDTFRKEGMEADTLLATGCALARAVVEQATAYEAAKAEGAANG